MWNHYEEVFSERGSVFGWAEGMQMCCMDFGGFLNICDSANPAQDGQMFTPLPPTDMFGPPYKVVDQQNNSDAKKNELGETKKQRLKVKTAKETNEGTGTLNFQGLKEIQEKENNTNKYCLELHPVRYLKRFMHRGFYNVAADFKSVCCQYYEPRNISAQVLHSLNS